ncbi:hypothetical protein D9619_011944 [Psilocybe cf. subviscida]|uniref:Uncharacterized protein n=1 Tax=Psilocybe cf. subviscida TaxID=2480587 RepID=A0A8H5B0K4_9AGAR|nr:hypothetical protein D9619_011944 [Psilocybe cf. subviscida]
MPKASPVRMRDKKESLQKLSHDHQSHDKPSSTAEASDATGGSTSSSRPNFNIIDGHDYAHAEFVEIDKKFKDDVLPNLPIIGGMSLLRLTGPNGPGRKYRGGWRDLFADKTRFDKMKWISMGNMLLMASEARLRLNFGCMFRVWFCPPGLIHIEYDDDGSWSVSDVLDLPKWLLVG